MEKNNEDDVLLEELDFDLYGAFDISELSGYKPFCHGAVDSFEKISEFEDNEFKTWFFKKARIKLKVYKNGFDAQIGNLLFCANNHNALYRKHKITGATKVIQVDGSIPTVPLHVIWYSEMFTDYIRDLLKNNLYFDSEDFDD